MQNARAVQEHPRYPVSTDVDVITRGSEVELLPVLNISLGGMFIKTTSAWTPGSELRLRLHDSSTDATLGLAARVVHVIDEELGTRKNHPPGMGVRYDKLSPQGEVMLRLFVESLARAGVEPVARTPSVCFIAPGLVVVAGDRAVLRELWAQNLRVGGLYAHGDAPPLGARVDVRIGPLRLHAEVVHADPGRGAGLQILDWVGAPRVALERYLAGDADQIVAPSVAVTGPPIGKLLAMVRQLFASLDEGDAFTAVGLPETAKLDDVTQRVASLRRMFAAPRPDASPPQAARLEAATRALQRLEPTLVARVSALRREAQLLPQEETAQRKAAVAAILVTAGAAQRNGDLNEARRHLTRALELAPEDADVRRRFDENQQNIDAARAADLLTQAEVFVKGLGMTDDAIDHANRALALSQLRAIRLRALAVLAKAGGVHEAIAVAEDLLRLDARDALALSAATLLYEKAKDWPRAAQAGAALLRLRPDDDALAQKVKRLRKAAGV